MKNSKITIGTNSYDLHSGLLTDAEGEVPELRHQSREVLRLLAESPGRTVTKAEFFDKVWERAHVSEDSLGQCIAEIRQALGDIDRRLVETVPRKGYRLNASAVSGTGGRFRYPIAFAALLGLAAVLLLVIWPRSPPSRQVVAVLPFHDASAPKHRGLMSEPVSEGILSHLVRYPNLTVIARGSSFRFRGAESDLREIGQQLGADYLVEGNLQFDGARVAVTPALVDVGNNTQVWSDRIEVEIGDLFAAIAGIGQRIAFQVEGVVTDVQVSDVSIRKPDAFLLSLQARKVALSGLSRDNNDTAIALNRRAVALSPDEPWGHMGLAFALRTRLRFGWADEPDAVLAEANRHAETAVGLAPENYTAHFALGRVRMQQGNQLAAITAFERALHLNPSSADAMNALAQSYFYLGQNARALEVLAQSALIDPLPGFIHPWMTAWVLWQDAQCDAAADAFRRLSAPPPEAHKLLSAIHVCRGEIEAARRALQVFRSASPDWTLAREASIHAGVWTFEAGRERWLDAQRVVGLPEG